MSTRSATVLGVALFLSIGSVAHAQSGMYTVGNLSNEKLTVNTLDPAAGTWVAQVLAPHQQRRVPLANAGDIGKIRVATPNRGYVEYATRSGWTYNVAWNARKEVWDVTTGAKGENAPPSDANPVPRSASSAYASVSPFRDWTLSSTACRRVGSDTRCAFTVVNRSGEKKGFRIEDVRVMHGLEAEDANDFNYYPRASDGMEGTEGHCTPGSRCTVEFSYGGPVADRMEFALSIWGASFTGSKENQSKTVSLRLPPPR